MGLVWKVCEPDDLLPEARRHAELLAARPISSLVAVKRTMTEPLRAGIAAARERENAAFAELMGGPANLEALTAFAEGRRAGLHEPAAGLVSRPIDAACRRTASLSAASTNGTSDSHASVTASTRPSPGSRRTSRM